MRLQYFKKAFFISLALFLQTSVFRFGVFGDPRGARLLNAMQRKFSAIKSLEGDFVLSISGGGNTGRVKASGKIFVEDHRLRMETFMDTQGKGGKPMKVHILFLYSGDTLWEKAEPLPASSSAALLGRINVAYLEKKFPRLFRQTSFLNFLNPAAAATQLDPKHVHFLGEVFLGMSKLKTYVMESPPRLLSQTLDFPVGGEKTAPARVRVWIGIHDGVAYRTTLIEKNGLERMRFSFLRVRVNPAIPPALFSPIPSKKGEVVDLTPFMSQMIEQAIGSKSNPGKTQ